MIHGFKGFLVWKTHEWCYFQDLTSFEASKLARIQDGRHFGNTSYQNIGSNHIQAWNTYFLGFSSVNKLILDNVGSYIMEFKIILRVFRKKWPPFLTKMATGNQVQYEMVMWYVFCVGFGYEKQTPDIFCKIWHRVKQIYWLKIPNVDHFDELGHRKSGSNCY